MTIDATHSLAMTTLEPARMLVRSAGTNAMLGDTGVGREEGSQQVRAAAEQFERVFLSQVLSTMTSGLESSQGASVGGDDHYSSMLRDQYAELIAKRGGIGLAYAVLRQLLQVQERD